MLVYLYFTNQGVVETQKLIIGGEKTTEKRKYFQMLCDINNSVNVERAYIQDRIE